MGCGCVCVYRNDATLAAMFLFVQEFHFFMIIIYIYPCFIFDFVFSVGLELCIAACILPSADYSMNVLMLYSFYLKLWRKDENPVA